MTIDSIQRGFSPMDKVIVKVSPKFQVVIPKAIREELQIAPGQQLLMYALDGSLRLVRIARLKSCAAWRRG
jgi:AbrB family looped-hinge helix DNA binding protein